MPSPFPGMDPFLEDPAHWPDFHNAFVARVSEDLNAALPRRYVARLDERCYILNPKQPFIPDISAKRRPIRVTRHRELSATATLTRSIDTPLVVRSQPYEIREWYVNVLDLNQGQR